MPELIFHESSHEYRLDGVPLRNVTGILKRRFNLVYPPGPYRVRGKRVHKACELVDRGIEIIQLGEEVALYLKSYILMMQQHKFIWDPNLIEVPDYDKELLVAGMSDCIGMYDGWPSLLDRKTGLTGPETALQTAAYVRMRFPRSEWFKVRRFKAILDKTGKPAKLVEFRDEWDFAAWKGLVEWDGWMLQQKVKTFA